MQPKTNGRQSYLLSSQDLYSKDMQHKTNGRQSYLFSSQVLYSTGQDSSVTGPDCDVRGARQVLWRRGPRFQWVFYRHGICKRTNAFIIAQ